MSYRTHMELPKRLRDKLERVFADHIDYKTGKGRGRCSTQTRYARRTIILLCFTQLRERGFELKSPQSLGSRHVEALTQLWAEQNLSAGTLHTRLSYLNTFSGWIGKKGIVKRPREYFPPEKCRRTSVRKKDRSWESMGIDPLEVIERARQIDERVALYLSLQYHLGLRAKESLEFHPAKALVDNGNTIEVFEGTKGGRPRRIPIELLQQREALAWARAVAAKSHRGRIRWPDCTFEQAQDRFYHIVEKRLGISLEQCGVTPHGLRHSYAQRFYARRTGLPTPVQGGALGKIDYETHHRVSMEVSNALGHGRIGVVANYYGSYGHALRVTKVACC